MGIKEGFLLTIGGMLAFVFARFMKAIFIGLVFLTLWIVFFTETVFTFVK